MYLGFILRLSGHGRARDVSTTSGPRATSADMTSTPTSETQSLPSRSATAESRPRSRQPTLRDRSPSCESDILMPRSSLTSDRDSISGARGYSPYWNEYTEEINSGLWSPTETVLRDLEHSSSGPCSNATAGNSWFSIKETSAPKRRSRLTFSPSSLSSALGSTACGDTARKSRKIRLYPDARQRTELRRWFGAARYAYNQTVELLTKEDAPPTVKTKIRDIILPTLPPWHRSAPREVLVGAVFDASRAVSAAKKRNAALAKSDTSDRNFSRVRFRSERTRGRY